MEEKREGSGDLRQFEENPFNPEKKKPEDIIRIFYLNSLSILPVVTASGLVLGILKKEDVVAELSDIERTRDMKVDQFITSLARKMSFDELLPYVGAQREFVTIDLFGEVKGKWSRLDLLSACEAHPKARAAEEDADQQREKQIMEWMIYLILEHIPRALYAVNLKGRTIFYNSRFEELFKARMGVEIDTDFIEESIKNAEKNEFFSRKKDEREIYFYNTEMNFYYEKVPLISDGKTVGFLIYCDRDMNDEPGVVLPGLNIGGLSLAQILEAVERGLIVSTLKECAFDIGEVAAELQLSRPALMSRIKKFGITIEEEKSASGKK